MKVSELVLFVSLFGLGRGCEGNILESA